MSNKLKPCPVCTVNGCDQMWHDYYQDTKHADFEEPRLGEYFKAGYEMAYRKLEAKNKDLIETLEGIRKLCRINPEMCRLLVDEKAKQALTKQSETNCKDCGIETKPGSGSARCPDCWDDRLGNVGEDE